MRAADDSQQTFRPPMGQVERSVFEVALETKKPVIAALNGSAIAGGFELALACDLRITHPDAQFGLPEAKIGMGANFSSVMLPRLIAPCIALEMLMTGDTISAEQAFGYGLLNRSCRAARSCRRVWPGEQDRRQRAASVRRMKATAWRGWICRWPPRCVSTWGLTLISARIARKASRRVGETQAGVAGR